MSSATSQMVAIVTGSNTGIGYQIARGLGARMKTVITSRNDERGREALAALRKADSTLDLHYHQLDITDSKSVQRFSEWISNTFGKIDVLVNNAAIAFKARDPTPFEGQTAPTLHTNVYCTMKFTETMLPLMQTDAKLGGSRIVFLASQAGTSALSRCSSALQARWTSETLDKKGTYQLLTEFTDAVQDGSYRNQGWPSSNYGISKLAVIALTKHLARALRSQNILVNCVCPGYCATNMSSHRGNRSAATGSLGAIRLATLPLDGPTGGFWFDERLLW